MRLRRSGTEPLTARSAYTLRTVLAALALVGGVAAAIVFGLAASQSGGSRAGELAVAVVGVVTAVIALVDLFIIQQRRRQLPG